MPNSKNLYTSEEIKDLAGKRGQIACHVNYRESQSYSSPGSVVSFYINGQLQARCHGGGYDMTGTVVGDWMSRAFKKELKQLALGIFFNEERIYLPFHNGLYGLALSDKNDAARLDGGCGINTMLFVLGLLGYRLQYFNETGSRTNYALRRLQEDDYEFETHQREAFLCVPVDAELEVTRVERKHREGEPAWQATMRKNGETRETTTFQAGELFNKPISKKFMALLSTTYITQQMWEQQCRSIWISSERLLHRFGAHRQDTYLIETVLSGDILTWKDVIDEFL